jgi:hypothetical protein
MYFFIRVCKQSYNCKFLKRRNLLANLFKETNIFLFPLINVKRLRKDFGKKL